MIDEPESLEELRDLFVACADVIRRYGKDGVPMTTLARAFSMVWVEFSDENAAQFFDRLASWYDEPHDPLAVIPLRPANQRDERPRRFRSWFS